MSIPSADHTIYSFITLCLKEQGDIAGRKEITGQHIGGWGKKKKSDAIIDIDISPWQVYGSGAGLLFGGWGGTRKRGCPTPPLTPTCASPKLQHVPPCRGSRIQSLTYPLMIWFTLLFSCLHAFLEVTGRTDRGGGLKRGRADRKGGWSAFSPQSHEFLWTGQMLPHIF